MSIIDYMAANPIESIVLIVVILAAAFVMVFLTKKLGVEMSTIIEAIKIVIKELKDEGLMEKTKAAKVSTGTQTPVNSTAPQEQTEGIQTEYGVFYRNTLSDSPGVYIGKANLGRGEFDAAYIDVERWQAAGGRIIRIASVPEGMSWYTMFSRFGISIQGFYSKTGNVIYSLVDNPFAGGQADEQKKRDLLKMKVIDAYARMQIMEGKITGYNDPRIVTGARYNEIILPDIIRRGFTEESFVNVYGAK